MWRPVQEHGGLAARIVAQVERLIDDRSLQPGDRLPPEREMATMLHVSRPSLREAIRVLEAQGRLVVRHGQGVFVLPARSEQELRRHLAATEMTVSEIFAMREVLEVPAATWAASTITASELAALRRLVDEMGDLVDAAGGTVEAGHEDADRLADLDAAFHLGIAAASGNRFLRSTSGVLHDMLLAGMETTLTIRGRAARSRRDHEAIYAALSARDGFAAGAAALAHISGARDAARRRLAEVGPVPPRDIG